MIDRTIAPPLSLPEKITISDPEFVELKNRIPLYIINGGTQDVARIEFLFNAGSGAHKHPLVATLANELIDEGTKKRSSLEIASLFDFYGAYLQTECTADYASVTLFTLNKFLKETVTLLLEIINDASYPEEEVSTFIQQEKQRLIINLEKVDFLARRHFNASLYNNHIYGYFPDPLDYDSLPQGVANEFHRNHYAEGMIAVIAAGRFTAVDYKLISDLAETATMKTSPGSKPAVIPPSAPVEKHVEKPGAVQNAIRIGKRMFNRRHPDYPGMTVVNAILGGYFGSRLMTNIREDKGFTYGIGSALVSLAQDGYFFIATEVGSEVCKAALAEIRAEVARLQEKLVPEEELALVKNYLTGSFQRSIDGPFALAERFKTVLLSGLNYDYFRTYLDIVKNIDSQSVMQLSGQYLRHSEMTQVTVGQNYL